MHVPPHEAAHGFRPGRSVMTFVAPHVGQTIVLKMDLRDFFVSITSARVIAIFLTAGYPEPVARLLTGLCTNTVPCRCGSRQLDSELDLARSPAAWRSRRLYRQPHLPQGAPDFAGPGQPGRLSARRAAGRPGQGRRGHLHPLRRRPGLLRRRVVCADDRPVPDPRRRDRARGGFAVQHRKTRVMRQGVRQRAAGVVINQKINITRDDYDQFKAILHNCGTMARRAKTAPACPTFGAPGGPSCPCRRLNRERGAWLKQWFEQIAW